MKKSKQVKTLLFSKINYSFILLFLFLFANPQISFSQYNSTLEEKTITGYVINSFGEPWHNQIAELYEGENLTATDTIKNGYFTFENINIVSVNDFTEVNSFSLEQNYPNPFNPSTIINYSINKPQNISLVIYDILGRKVKTLFKGYSSSGTFSLSWNGTNNFGIGVSAGVYLYALNGEENQIVRKMILLDGNKSNNSISVKYGQVVQPLVDVNLLLKKNMEVFDYTLKIKGSNVISTSFTNLNLGGTGTIDLGTFICGAKPILTGFVYDIETKYDEKGNRLTPQGIDSMKVYLVTNPEAFVYTNENGKFNIGLDSIPGNIVEYDSTFGPGIPYHLTIKDTLIITGKTPEDTTYYFFKTPIGKTVYDPAYNFDTTKVNEIKEGINILTAFNDTTGIPMIKRWRDPENGVDFLEHLKYVTNMENLAKEDPIWEGIILRIKDSNLPIKVYMNRENDPTDGWYADSSLVGLQAMQTGRFRFEETTDTAQALLFMRYDNDMIGQGLNKEYQEDEQGIHLTHYEISIRGPSGGSTLGYYTPMLVAHEALHIVFGGGNHSPYEQDMFYLDPLTRKDDGYPLATTEREKKGIRLLYNLERNPKLGQYGRWINSRNLLSQQYLFCKISKMSVN